MQCDRNCYAIMKFSTLKGFDKRKIKMTMRFNVYSTGFNSSASFRLIKHNSFLFSRDKDARSLKSNLKMQYSWCM